MKKIYHLFIDGENPDEVLKEIENLIQFYGYDISIID